MITSHAAQARLGNSCFTILAWQIKSSHPFIWKINLFSVFLFEILETIPETNSLHLPGKYPKRKLAFQPSVFRFYIWFRGRSLFGNFAQTIPRLNSCARKFNWKQGAGNRKTTTQLHQTYVQWSGMEFESKWGKALRLTWQSAKPIKNLSISFAARNCKTSEKDSMGETFCVKLFVSKSLSS